MYLDECRSGPKSNDDGLVKGGVWVIVFNVTFNNNSIISWRSVLSGYLHFQKFGRTKVTNRNK